MFICVNFFDNLQQQLYIINFPALLSECITVKCQSLIIGVTFKMLNSGLTKRKRLNGCKSSCYDPNP